MVKKSERKLFFRERGNHKYSQSCIMAKMNDICSRIQEKRKTNNPCRKVDIIKRKLTDVADAMSALPTKKSRLGYEEKTELLWSIIWNNCDRHYCPLFPNKLRQSFPSSYDGLFYEMA